MDYMAELAEHPNVLEALALLRADVVKGMARAPLEPAAAAALERLSQCSSFLRDEHPHTWVTELIHAFYQTPPLAAAAWKYLRYCAGFRHTLAERLLLEKRRWRLRPEISRDLLAAIGHCVDALFVELQALHQGGRQFRRLGGGRYEQRRRRDEQHG